MFRFIYIKIVLYSQKFWGIMARQRKSVSVDKQPKPVKSNFKERFDKNEPSPFRTSIKVVACFVCITIAAYVGYKGYLETRVNTPYDDNKMVVKSGLDVPERYWGSYRPGVYFGMKTREPYSPVFGIMWYLPSILRATGVGIRHWCENSDNLNRFIWTEHDGVNFGVQEIEDGPFRLTTSFVKRSGYKGGDWTARIAITNPDNVMAHEPMALLLYTAIERQTKGLIAAKKRQGLFGVVGQTDKLGKFSIRLMNISGTIEHHSYLSTEAKGLDVLKETLMSSFVVNSVDGKGRLIMLPGDLTKGNPTNFVVSQLIVKAPFVIDVVYESESVDRINMLTGPVYVNELKQHSDNFHQKFERVFGLNEKGYDEDKVKFAEAAVSNLLGGIGYFYGSSRVKSEFTKEPVPYWKAPLYTAVPSRSFFPRGFLWDEGFHGLIIAMWDMDIELDIIAHWFDLMNVEGWIPREQILGTEALAKVPEEFVTQINTNANPPTFFLTLKHILTNLRSEVMAERRLAMLDRLYPRLTAWFGWFNTTQIGLVPGSYRWRGRDAKTELELNPKTLTSGLDDYPRASHPTNAERHVDLRCWVALGAATLAQLAEVLSRPAGVTKYQQTFLHLADQQLLDTLHWSTLLSRYADYGLHTDNVELVHSPPPTASSTPPADNREMVRKVLKPPVMKLNDNTFGYISLFPFLFHLMDSNSPKLEKVLNDIKNPDLCWTSYGLRSLGKTSPLYMKFNTQHDAPYWRGPIWVNMNFMAVRALQHYSRVPGPYSILSAEIYDKLKTILINNIFREYKRTGYIWEQYNDKTGEGQGTKSFTGWSSLVALLMADHL